LSPLVGIKASDLLGRPYLHGGATSRFDHLNHTSAEWLQHPCEIHLSRSQYHKLKEAWKSGVVSDAVYEQWCVKSFSGLIPDSLYNKVALNKKSSVWKDFYSNYYEMKRTREIGSSHFCECVYDLHGSVSCHRKYNAEDQTLKDLIKSEPDVNAIRKMVYDLVVTAPLYKGVSGLITHFNLIDILQPGTTNELWSRQGMKLSATLGFYLLARARSKGSNIHNYGSHIPITTNEKAEFLSNSEIVELLTIPGMGNQWLNNLFWYGMTCQYGTVVTRALFISGLLQHGLKSYITVTKTMHDVIRRSQRSFVPGILPDGIPYNEVLYLPVLAGRYDFADVNLDEEIYKRTKITKPQRVFDGEKWDHSAFVKVFDRVTDNMVEAYEAGNSMFIGTSAETFYANMTMFSTSGNTGMAPRVVVPNPYGGETAMEKSKQLWLQSVGTHYIENMLMQEPGATTKGAAKYEASKLRLLLPSDAHHWLVESVALMGAEGSVYRADANITINADAITEWYNLTRRISDASRDTVGFKVCSDFADHNYLHYIKLMVQMWLKFAKALDPSSSVMQRVWNKATSFRQFASSACRWAAAALLNLKAVVGPEQEVVHLIQGLWTGWRSTTFVNTIFNKVYQEAVITSFQNFYGYNPLREYNVLGDDMIGRVVDEWTAMRLLELYDYSGFEAVSFKQLMSDSRFEYLRVMYEPGSVTASPLRAISGFTSSDAQSGVSVFGISNGISKADGINMLLRRGSTSVLRSIFYTIVEWAMVGPKGTTAPPRWYVKGSTLTGGLGIIPYGDLALPLRHHLFQKSPIVEDSFFVAALDVMPDFSTKAALRLVTTTLAETGYKLRSNRAFYRDHMKATLSGATPVSWKKHINKQQLIAEQQFFKTLHQMRNDVVVDYEPVSSLEIDRTYLADPSQIGWNTEPVSSVLDAAVAIALGQVAVAGGVKHITTLSGKRVLAKDVVMRSRAPAACSLLQQAYSMYPSKFLDAYLEGKLDLKMVDNPVLGPLFRGWKNYVVSLTLRQFKFSQDISLVCGQIDANLYHLYKYILQQPAILKLNKH